MPKGGKQCAAFGCTNTSLDDNIKEKISFHKYPFNWGENHVKAWTVRLKRENFQPTTHTVVCSEHFEDSCFEYQNFTGRRGLKRGSEPTIFKHNTDENKKQRKRTSYQFKEGVSSTVEDTRHTKDAGTETSADFISELLGRVNRLEEENTALKQENAALKEVLTKSNFGFSNLSSEATPQCDKIKMWTGFSFQKFLVMFQFFSFMTCLQVVSRKCLSPKDQFFMCLIKLRHGLNNNILAFMFKISPASVSRIFNSVIFAMYAKSKSVNIWPSKELIRTFMPPEFAKSFSTTRVIIDCCEYFIQQPKKPIHQQASFSMYKNHNTAKALIGIAPSGAISFISDLYMGSISDKQITIKSGLIDMLEEGDLVLADKGFTCLNDNFKEKNIVLKTPHFLKHNDQFSLSERTDNKNISHLRIHVERAISRIKNFKLFDQEMDFGLLSIIEEMHYVTCFLTLFMDPLINCSNEANDTTVKP